jgi:hypothetical protein
MKLGMSWKAFFAYRSVKTWWKPYADAGVISEIRL